MNKVFKFTLISVCILVLIIFTILVALHKSWIIPLKFESSNKLDGQLIGFVNQSLSKILGPIITKDNTLLIYRDPLLNNVGYTEKLDGKVLRSKMENRISLESAFLSLIISNNNNNRLVLYQFNNKYIEDDDKLDIVRLFDIPISNTIDDILMIDGNYKDLTSIRVICQEKKNNLYIFDRFGKLIYTEKHDKPIIYGSGGLLLHQFLFTFNGSKILKYRLLNNKFIPYREYDCEYILDKSSKATNYEITEQFDYDNLDCAIYDINNIAYIRENTITKISINNIFASYGSNVYYTNNTAHLICSTRGNPVIYLGAISTGKHNSLLSFGMYDRYSDNSYILDRNDNNNHTPFMVIPRIDNDEITCNVQVINFQKLQTKYLYCTQVRDKNEDKRKFYFYTDHGIYTFEDDYSFYKSRKGKYYTLDKITIK